RAAFEHSGLTEDVARPKLGHVLALPGDLGGSLLDRHQRPREAALLDHGLTVLDLFALGEGCDLLQPFVVCVREQWNPLQLGGVPCGPGSSARYPIAWCSGHLRHCQLARGETRWDLWTTSSRHRRWPSRAAPGR